MLSLFQCHRLPSISPAILLSSDCETFTRSYGSGIGFVCSLAQNLDMRSWKNDLYRFGSGSGGIPFRSADLLVQLLKSDGIRVATTTTRRIL